MMMSSNGSIFRVTVHLCVEPVNSPYKGQWRGALMFSLICVRIIGWVNNGEAGDLRCHHAHYDVIVMWYDEHFWGIHHQVNATRFQWSWVNIRSVIARFMGPTWGPSGADRTQVGSMLAPWTLLSGVSNVCQTAINSTDRKHGNK